MDNSSPDSLHSFGSYLRQRREYRQSTDGRAFSLRQVAMAAGIEPSYLSKIERGLQAPPGEDCIRRLAQCLEEDPDLLLAMAGKVSSDLLNIIRARPVVFGEILRQLKGLPDNAVLRLVREIRDGDW